MPEGIQAGGTIQPKRVVRLNSSAGNNRVTQAAAATAPLYGISGQGPRLTVAVVGVSSTDAGAHALSGENCKVYGMGEFAPATAGGTITAGALLTSDANGKVVATTTDGNFIIGDAMHGCAAEEDCLVRIRPGQRAS
jgi:hypothetical protein